MPPRKIRRSVGLLVLCSMAASGGLTWWSTAAALSVPPPDDEDNVTPAAVGPPAGRSAIEPAAEHWRLSLQQRLFDPPSEPPAEPTPDPEPPPVRRAPPNWKLLGTIIESRGNTAILETAPGTVQVRRAGQRLSGVEAEVLSVGEDNVTLSYDGGEVLIATTSIPVSRNSSSFGANACRWRRSGEAVR